MENSLLIGNGILRSYNEDFAWDKILKSCVKSETELLSGNKIPYTHIFEDILLNKKAKSCNPNDGIESYAKEIKQKIADHLNDLCKDFVSKPIDGLEKLPKCNIQHFVTTNYDNIMGTILRRGLNKEKADEISNKESYYNLSRFKVYNNEKHAQKTYIWNIHGSVDKPDTIMLGYQHYCDSVARIERYVKTGKGYNEDQNDPLLREGGFKYKPNAPEFLLHKIHLFNEGKNVEFKRWVDLFFMTDMHIVGFGMDYSEIDLWYVLNRRKIYRSSQVVDSYIPSNKIYFYGGTNEQKELLKAYDVEVFDDIKYPEDNKNMKWKKYHEECIDKALSFINSNNDT